MYSVPWATFQNEPLSTTSIPSAPPITSITAPYFDCIILQNQTLYVLCKLRKIKDYLEIRDDFDENVIKLYRYSDGLKN